MRYQTTFKNINGKEYTFYIPIKDTDLESDPIPFTLTNDVTIRVSSNSLFAPIKSRSLSFTMLSKDYYMGLYQAESRKAQVTITDDEDNIIFRGYIQPNVYSQNFTYIDEITIEAVDAISTAKDFDWVNTYKYESIFDIIQLIISECGYEGNLYIPQTYEKINGNNISGELLKQLYISSANFIDDDEKHTPNKHYDVLEEILNFLGWTLTIDGDDIWLIDYRALNAGPVTYNIYDIQTGLVDINNADITLDETTALTLEDRAAGTSQLDIDDVYNKIEISDNVYEIDEVSPDIFEDKWHISINDEQNFDYNGQKWIKKDRSGWLWWAKTTTKETGYDYQTICRLDESSGWKHKYYRKAPTKVNNEWVFTELDSYYDENSPSRFTVGKINQYCNTAGCLIQHHAYRPNTGNQLPTSLDWENLLTFFILDDTCDNNCLKTIYDLEKWELPVLEYTTTEEVMYRPSSGISWITIKGDLYYQNNKGADDKNKHPFTIINYDEYYYATAPVDKAVDVKSDSEYMGVHREISKKGDIPDNYGSGWECWKMKLQIGDKYWNGSEWTTTESTFYINYNNGPSYEPESKEYLPTFDWASPVNRSSFKDRVGVDGYCIPICSESDDPGWTKYGESPTKGILKLTIYIPSLLPQSMKNLVIAGHMYAEILSYILNLNYNYSNESVPWCVFCKDFELGYVYTDTGAWWNSHEDSNKKDKVYYGYIDDNYVKDFSRLELKVNTTSKDKPISRSYVTLDSGYLETLKHKCGDTSKVQEYNVVDLYLDHHSDKKIMYKCNLHGLQKPYNKFTTNNLSGTFVIDKQNYDLYNDNNSINMIVF